MSFREQLQQKQKIQTRDFKFEKLDLNLPEEPLTILKDSSGRRIYVDVDNNQYLSVTSLLAMNKSPALERWIKSVGKEYADKLKNQGAVRGKSLHKICEAYLLGEHIDTGSITLNADLFYQIKSVLDSNVDTVCGIEQQLISHKLQLAGTADLICKYDNKLSIVDFKNSRKEKKEEHIINYFLQTTAYSMMVEELNPNLKVEQIVIIIASPEATKPQIWIKDPNTYKKQLVDLTENLWLKTLTSDSVLEIFQNISND